MRTLIITLALVSSSFVAAAQQLNVLVGAEKSVKKPEYNMGVRYETKGHWGIGAFYQAAVNSHSEGKAVKLENPFYGVNIQTPLAKSSKLLFTLNLRAGFVNEKFFVVVPCLETRLQSFKRFGAVFGMGLRHGYPSASIKIITKVF